MRRCGSATDADVQEKKKKPDHVGDSRMELFPVKDPRDMLTDYSVHIYIMTDGEKWKKHYISRGGGDALALLLLVV